MTNRASTLSPYQEALAAALEADALLVAELAAPDAIFSLGTVPKDQPTPFLELGDVSERALSTFGKGGNLTEQTIVIVSPREEGIPKVAKIYARLVWLENTPIAIAGHVVALSRVEITTIYNDPNGTDTRGIVRYTVQSHNA